ncbi:hypothetical protein D8682_24615 [Buttiauxella sp. 3AFRM03]|nr:hypothetical protein D8682_24615 [Buttiauxella sp. 3AFRM03]
MGCLKCGRKETIRAHLIPKVFCREVQVGKMHAAGVVGSNKFTPTQSGIFDKHILCAKCDGELGDLENYAAKKFRVIRSNFKNSKLGVHEMLSADSNKILRFAAGILWKYSIAAKDFGQIDLLGFDDEIKKYAYGEIEKPSFLDGCFFWLRLNEGSSDLFAYRAPIMMSIDGVNTFKFLLGGMLFFIKVDDKDLLLPQFKDLLLGNSLGIRFLLAPALLSEEFQEARKLAFSQGSLSDFLDKNGS